MLISHLSKAILTGAHHSLEWQKGRNILVLASMSYASAHSQRPGDRLWSLELSYFPESRSHLAVVMYFAFFAEHLPTW